MKRKLVKQGAATMMISLPSKWIKENNLGKGDEIDLVEENNLIRVGVEIKIKKNFEIEINQDNVHDLYPILTHAYRKGFDKIVLKGKSNDIAREVRKITNDILLGFEITDIANNSIVLENISEPTEQKYDIMMKKVFQIIEETHSLILRDFEKNKFDSMGDIEDLRKQQDRFILFCRRLLVKGKAEKSIELNWELLTFLMHIEHSFFYMYKYIDENGIAKDSETIKLLGELGKYYGLFKNAYFDSDIASIHKINNLKKQYQFGDCIKSLEKSRGEKTVVDSYIREIFRWIQIATSPILSIKFDN